MRGGFAITTCENKGLKRGKRIWKIAACFRTLVSFGQRFFLSQQAYEIDDVSSF
jgi:hypothetical protein